MYLDADAGGLTGQHQVEKERRGGAGRQGQRAGGVLNARTRLREAIERELKEWQQRAEEELDRLLEEFKAWLLDLIRRELERQTKRWLDKICGSNAVLLVGGLLVALRRRRR